MGDINGAFRRHTAIFPVRTCSGNPNFPLAAAKEGRCRSEGHGEQYRTCGLSAQQACAPTGEMEKSHINTTVVGHYQT